MATGAITIPMLAELAGRAALVLALAWIGARLAFRRSASTRYAVWAAGFIAAFALPIATGVLPAWHLAVLPPPDGCTGRGVATTRQSTAVPLAGAALGAHNARRRAHGAASAPPTAVAAPEASTPGLPWALIAWAAIAAGLILRYVASLLAVRWMTRHAQPLEDRRWRDALDVASAMLGLTRTPRLLASTRVAVPFTCGLLRPVLVVPTLGTRLGRRAHPRRASPRARARRPARLPPAGSQPCRLRALLVQPARMAGRPATARRARACLRRSRACLGHRRRRIRAAPARHRSCRDGRCAAAACQCGAGDGAAIGARRPPARDSRSAPQPSARGAERSLAGRSARDRRRAAAGHGAARRAASRRHACADVRPRPPWQRPIRRPRLPPHHRPRLLRRQRPRLLVTPAAGRRCAAGSAGGIAGGVVGGRRALARGNG